MKDFYDLWFLTPSWPFRMIAPSDAIRATFERRGNSAACRDSIGSHARIPFRRLEVTSMARLGNAFGSIPPLPPSMKLAKP
jgi:hypothetical protein